MEKYIDQLIGDFQSSADSVKDLMDGKVYPEKPEDLQAEVDQALFLVLSEYLNILPIQFPPIELLPTSGSSNPKIPNHSKTSFSGSTYSNFLRLAYCHL